MIKNSHRKILFALLLLTLAACTKPLQTKVITGLGGKIQITVPGAWKEETDLNKSADLQASYRPSEMYIVVLTESKDDFHDMNLEKHSQLTRDALNKKLTDPQTLMPVSLTIDGHPALEYEIRGAIDNLNIVYLHTTIETEKNYHQILTWTTPSHFEENRPTLQKVITNFREISSTPTSTSSPHN